MYYDPSGTSLEWIRDVGQFTGGLVITISSAVTLLYSLPLLVIPGLSSLPLFQINMLGYGAMLIASPFNSTIKSDMKRIDWNPFNKSEDNVLKSDNISFYKGTFVFRYGTHSTGGGGFSYGIIGIGRGETRLTTVKHEYGHHKQQRLMGLTLYTPIVAIPSLISAATSRPSQHANRWYEQ